MIGKISNCWLDMSIALMIPALAAQAQSAKALIDQAGNAMGGTAALRANNNQVIESEGKQFNSAPMLNRSDHTARSALSVTR